MRCITLLGFVLLVFSAWAQDQPAASTSEEQLLKKRFDEDFELNLEKYKRYPRRLFVGTTTSEEVTRYLTPVLFKIEQVGTAYYPTDARGKIYGTVIVTFEIRASGELGSVTVSRSSEHEVLDKAAVLAVRASAPFAPFPKEIKETAEILVVTRTLRFEKARDRDFRINSAL